MLPYEQWNSTTAQTCGYYTVANNFADRQTLSPFSDTKYD